MNFTITLSASHILAIEARLKKQPNNPPVATTADYLAQVLRNDAQQNAQYLVAGIQDEIKVAAQ